MKDRREYASLDFGALIDRELPREWFGEAVQMVRDMNERQGWIQHEKREFATGMLMQHLLIEEHQARCLIELAILFLKSHDRP